MTRGNGKLRSGRFLFPITSRSRPRPLLSVVRLPANAPVRPRVSAPSLNHLSQFPSETMKRRRRRNGGLTNRRAMAKETWEDTVTHAICPPHLSLATYQWTRLASSHRKKELLPKLRSQRLFPSLLLSYFRLLSVALTDTSRAAEHSFTNIIMPDSQSQSDRDRKRTAHSSPLLGLLFPTPELFATRIRMNLSHFFI